MLKILDSQKIREATAEALVELELELEIATTAFGPFASAHEGFAVLGEEVDASSGG